MNNDTITAAAPAIAEEIEVQAMPKNPKPLASISAPYASKPLGISKKLSVGKSTEVMPCICDFTGIVLELVIPQIAGTAFSYENPLAKFKNAKGIVQQGENYLKKLDSQILAGLWITVYRNYGLLAESSIKNTNSSILNALLRTAGKDILINSLLFSTYINSSNASRLPAIALDYETHKHSSSLAPTLQEYTKLLSSILYPPAAKAATAADIELSEIQAFQQAKKAQAKRIGRSDVEKAFEEDFAENKRVAKRLIAELADSMAVPSKLIAFLRTITTGRHLVVMDSGLRSNIVAKLKGYKLPQTDKLATIVEESNNPYDIFAKMDEAMVEASDSFASVAQATVKPKTIAEILAEKRAAASSSAPKNAGNNSGEDF